MQKKRILYIKQRNNKIPMELVNNFVYVHTGKKYVKVLVTRERVGFRFGEFAYTRTRNRRTTKRKKKR